MPAKTQRGRSRPRKQKRLSHGREVVFNRRGLLLSTDTSNPTARRLLESALSYDRTVHLRGKAAKLAGRNVVTEEVACFDYIEDPHRVMPEMFCCGAGWISKIRQTLRQSGFNSKIINRTPHKNPQIFVPRWDRLRGIQLRYRQDEVINTLLRYDYGRVDCPTGYGKSWMIAAMCQLLPKCRFHITTHSKDVITQLYYDLCKALPSVGIVTGDKKKRRDSRVMVFSGKSLHHGGFDTDILLVDEVHEFGTADYMQRVQNYRNARIYGFSASHDARPDNADFELEGLFGPIRVSVSYKEAEEYDCVVPIKTQWVDVVSDTNPCDGLDDPVARNRWGIWRHRLRNKKIAEVAGRFGDDVQVLIVVDTIDHAVHLKKFLPDFQLCYSENGMDARDRNKFIKWGLIDPHEPVMTLERRHHLKNRFSRGSLKKVIATGVWNRGVDFRQLQVLIRADAKASKIADTQIPGRVARTALPGQAKPFGLVIDFKDQFDSNFREKALKRRRNYKAMGWEQLEPREEMTGRRRKQRKADPNQPELF